MKQHLQSTEAWAELSRYPKLEWIHLLTEDQIPHVLVFVMQCIRQAFIRYLLTYWFKPKKYVPSTLLSLLFLPQIVGTIFTPFCWASPNEKGQVCNQSNILKTLFFILPLLFALLPSNWKMWLWGPSLTRLNTFSQS